MSQNPPDSTSDDNNSLVPVPMGKSLSTLTGDKIALATRDLPEHQRDTLRWLYSTAKQMGWTLTDLKKETKIDDSTLYRVFNGTYPTRIDNIVKRIEDFRLRFEDRAKALQRGKVFVETSICRTIWEACEYAMATNTIAMVYGPSHIGKTWAFQEFQARNNHGRTKMARIPASAGVQLCMKELARGCYVSPNTSFENLRESVFKSVDSHNLFLIDELHGIFTSYLRGSAVKCLEVIRELHDRTGCGMVLGGTLKLQSELLLGDHRDLLEQFRRRTIVEVVLPNEMPWADVELIAEAYGLPSPKGEAADVVRKLVKSTGLKRYCLFLSNAQTIAAKGNKQIAWEHFIRAHDIVSRLSQGNQPRKAA